MNNPFQQLNDLYNKPKMLPGEVTQVDHLSQEDKTLLRKIGLTSVQVQRDLLADAQIFYDRYNIYHQVEHCLRGDTKIRLLDGSSPTIKEMADNPDKYIGKYTFSIDPATLELEPDKITSARKTRLNTQLVRVHLDSGEYVDTTPDHRFMLRDGTYREAQYLQPKDSLMPLYFKYPSGPLKNYLMVYKPKTDSYSFVHRIVAKFLDSTYKTGQGRVPHHIDFDSLNNDPSNIQIMDSTEHKKYHGGISRKKHKPDCSCCNCKLVRGELKGEDHPAYGRAPWNKGLTKETDPRVAEAAETKVQFYLTEEGRLLKLEIGRHTSENLTGGKLSPEHIERIAIGVKKFFDEGNIRVFSDPEAAHESLSEGQKKRFQDPDEYKKLVEHLKKVHIKNTKSKEVRICQFSDCNITFEVLPSSKRKYCSGECANKAIGKNKDAQQKHSVTQSKLWENAEYRKNQVEKQQAGKRKKAEERKAQVVECLLNHKVARVEWLEEREDTYDISTEKNHNFSLDVGIFVHNSLEHPIVGAAAELYANYCTVFSPMHNATCWITSESPTYQKELTKLLDRIGIEEKIFDWSFTTGSYGDMFVKVNGIPGQGVISVDDSDHPINISRIDHEGVLIGYYKTPVGQAGGEQRLMAPWEYVHFRLLGGKKQRPQFGDQSYAEFRTVHLLTGLRSKQVTTRYGTSVLMNALAIYRRLRLAEDSLLIARLSRGLIRYIWKLKVSSSNMEAVGELIDQYSRVLREARSMDTRPGSPNMDSKENPMCLQGDTKIKLLDGSSPIIKEMADNPDEYIGKYVLTVNEKTKHLEPKQIKNVKKTRLNAQLVRVHLSHKIGKYVDCTPDHKFMLEDGSYVEAQDLKVNNKLMPFYSCLNREDIREGIEEYIPGRACCVAKVVWLKEREDTYDIEIDGNPNFPLAAGVFVHNSSIEDIFIPVWDDVGDLVYDKIGGETDIRWIRDIEDLRQQLAAALRTPLPLLGAWLKEATGPLGSQAIEKVDINFARMARKLQRTIRTGIKRICQIHLAYMNMDPDPNLFDVQMPEMSTAEEESLKESLKDGMEVVGSMMEVVEGIVEGTDKELDKIEIFNYLNEKILKLEDFDLKEYLVATEVEPIEEPSIEELPEEERPVEQKRRERRDRTLKALRENRRMSDKRKERMVHELEIKKLLEKSMLPKDKDRIYAKPTLWDTDLMSYVPTQTHENGELNEAAVKLLGRNGGWLGIERCMEAWQATYGDAVIIDQEGELTDDVVVGQLELPFEGEKK